MSLLVSPEEYDRAEAAGKLQITGRANARAVRCVLSTCRKLIPPGEGRRLWIDGFRRGFVGLKSLGHVHVPSFKRGSQ